MNTVEQNTDQTPMTMADMPLGPDGLIDFRALAIRLVEDCLNAAMSLTVDELLGEGNRRNGYRERRLKTMIGEITIRIPKLREGIYFPEEILRPYSRTDRAMIGAVAEVYRLGLSTRKIERMAEELGFGSLSASAISRMTSTLDNDVAALQETEYDQDFPYLWLDATYVDCRDDGRVRGQAVVTAIAAGLDGSRRYVGLDVVDTESRDSWRSFLLGLRARGVRGVELVVSDAHAGLRRAIREVFPGASWQRCLAHLRRDVAARLSRKDDRAAAGQALSAVFGEGDPATVRAAYDRAAIEIGTLDRRAGELLEEAREDALCHLSFPTEHRIRVRTNNVQERANREIKRRTRVVQVFPSRRSLLRLVAAVCCDLNEEWAAAGHFMDAAGMRDLGRDAPPETEPDEDVLARAESVVLSAMEAVA